MIFNLALKFALSVLTALALAVGGYYAIKAQSARTLAQSFESNLESGEYLAALGAAGNLKAKGETPPELDEKIAAAARLLVAEDAYKKARVAREEKQFADAGALLRGSAALTDPSFKYFEEAKKLYAEVEALAASAAHKTAVAISALESRAEAEKKKREETEAARQALEGTVSEKERVITETKAEAAETARRLADSQREAEARQAALAQEQARARALMEAVEKESKQKFFTELRAYRDMAQKGKEQLENTIAEINAKRDVTALIYVSQGKILFEEAKVKAIDLRAKRTPMTYQSRVDDLVKSLESFLDASKQLRNAVVYIDEQGSAEFANSFSKGKTALANAASLLASVSDLIAANP